MSLPLRRARWTRYVLLIAGFLTVTGSFGLHPEPRSLGASAASGACWTTVNQSDSGSPHDCLACLAHRSISLPGLSPVVLQPGSSILATNAASASPLARLEAVLDEGRAPPPLA